MSPRWSGSRPVGPDAAARMIKGMIRRHPDALMAGSTVIHSLGDGWYLAWCSVCNGMAEDRDLGKLSREAADHSRTHPHGRLHRRVGDA